MEEIFNLIVQNGIGVASFGFLLFYIYNDKKDSTKVMKEISNTLTGVNISLNTLVDRVDKIEEKINK